MTPETPDRNYSEIRACWLSVDILIEHFPNLEHDICLLDDAEIAYLDKKACEMITCSYWIAMEFVITGYIKEKNNDKSEVNDIFDSGFE